MKKQLFTFIGGRHDSEVEEKEPSCKETIHIRLIPPKGQLVLVDIYEKCGPGMMMYVRSYIDKVYGNQPIIENVEQFL